MKKRIASSLPLLASLAAIWILFDTLNSEPRYQGKTLTAWLDQYGYSHRSNDHDLAQQAETAIHHFGTNLIPTYLKMLSTHPSAVKMKLLARIPPIWLKRLRLPSTLDYRLKLGSVRTRGAYGLVVLGPEARPAVPSLITLLTDKEDEVRALSVFTLYRLGPVARDALPSVIKCLNDPDDLVRIDAIMALGTIHEDPDSVVPILIDIVNQTRNSSQSVREYSAIRALGDFKDKAASAVPTLVKSLGDPDASVRGAAILALGSIHARPDLVVPALTARVAPEQQRNDYTYTFSTLAGFGPDARSAAPTVLEYINDNDPDVRACARYALKAIDPEAAAKAGIK
jgi:hypothetical protein